METSCCRQAVNGWAVRSDPPPKWRRSPSRGPLGAGLILFGQHIALRSSAPASQTANRNRGSCAPGSRVNSTLAFCPPLPPLMARGQGERHRSPVWYAVRSSKSRPYLSSSANLALRNVLDFRELRFSMPSTHVQYADQRWLRHGEFWPIQSNSDGPRYYSVAAKIQSDLTHKWRGCTASEGAPVHSIGSPPLKYLGCGNTICRSKPCRRTDAHPIR